MNEQGPWRIGHAKDHPMTVHGLKDLLAPEADLQWVGAAATVDALMQAYEGLDVP